MRTFILPALLLVLTGCRDKADDTSAVSTDDTGNTILDPDDTADEPMCYADADEDGYGDIDTIVPCHDGLAVDNSDDFFTGLPVLSTNQLKKRGNAGLFLTPEQRMQSRVEAL